MAELNFDANQVAPNTGSADPVPSAWYNAMIDESEMKPTKDGLGAYLQLRFSIVDGQYVNRKIYERLNLRNSNPVAVEIAYGDLSAIGHAIGVLQMQNSEQLHNLPMKIKVVLKPAKDGYEAGNEIKAFRNINEDVGGATPAGGAPAAAAPPAAGGFTPPPQQAPVQAPPAQQAPVQQQPMQAPPAAQEGAAGFQTAPAQPWGNAPPQQQAPVQQAPVQQAPIQPPAQQAPVQQTPQQAPQQPAQQPMQQAPAPQQQPVQHQAPAPAGGATPPPWNQAPA